ncbi:MAG: hypothetical protein ACTHJ3_03670 [Pararhizobium sp.]
MSRQAKVRWMVGLRVTAGVVLFAGANAHLVYVALASHPGCVAHLKDAGSGPGEFRAAQSAC